jgi:NodT family efflux transporter outer membrane factor (OMF) lipoprotein
MDLPEVFLTMKKARWIFLSGALLLTSACNIGPKYARPVTPVAPAFKEPAPPEFAEIKGWKAGEPRDNLIRGKWWEIFGDPDLSALEEQIDAGNQTLAAAEAQYRGAQAQIRVSRAALYPTLTGSTTAVASSNSSTILNAHTLSGNAVNKLLTFPDVTASWIPDLWGQVRKTVAGNVDTAQATAASLANVRLVLESELALDYYQLHGLDAQKQLLDTTIVAYQRALDLTVNRYNQGVASQVDVAQAQTQLQQTTAQSTDTLVLRQQYEHAIAVLLGRPPSELSIPVSAIKVDPPGIPFGVPSELLERRPDIAQNERLVAAANEQIGVALTAYYPTLTLGAAGGLEGSSLLNLFTWPSRFWTVGPSLSELFLDGGKRRGVTEQAQAVYDAAAANYRQTVLTAFQQVEDNIAALRILDRESKEQAEAIRYADRSLELANNQYQGGITAYLQVIQAQEIALSNEVTGVELKTRRMVASVDLVQALGGGWDASELPSHQETMPKHAKTAALR